MFPRQDHPDGFFSYYSSYYSSVAAAAASASASKAAEEEQDEDQDADQDEDSSKSVDKAAQSTSIGLSSPTTIDLAASTTYATSAALSTDPSTTAALAIPNPTDLISSAVGPTPSLTISMIKTPPWQTASATSMAAHSTITGVPAESVPNQTFQEKASDNKHSAIIAGVVVPIIVLLAGGLVFLACLRRRRRRRAAAATAATPAAAAPGLVEKIAHKRMNSDAGEPTTTTREMENAGMTAPQRPHQPHLLISSPQNPTYFTGLDTFSVHSAATSDEPPPPYRARSVLSQRSNEPAPYSIALSPISPLNEDMLSPFTDNHAVPPAAVTRTPSTISFASTLYSSNASVYEARPARRSVGAAHMVPGGPIEETVTSPFMDPESESEGEGQEPRRRV